MIARNAGVRGVARRSAAGVDRIGAPQVRHMPGLLFRRDTLRRTLGALLRKPQPASPPPGPGPAA